MIVEISVSAEADLDAAYDFYEERELGAGEEYLKSMERQCADLCWRAGIHRNVRGFFVMRADVFPYDIYYRIFGETVRVEAVLDQRQAPGRTRNDLDGRH